jgi:hypothetical protein
MIAFLDDVNSCCLRYFEDGIVVVCDLCRSHIGMPRDSPMLDWFDSLVQDATGVGESNDCNKLPRVKSYSMSMYVQDIIVMEA